jgi:hypothetical protein
MIIELRGNWTLIFIDFADLLQKPSVNFTLIYFKNKQIKHYDEKLDKKGVNKY